MRASETSTMAPSQGSQTEEGNTRVEPATRRIASTKFENNPNPAERNSRRVISASTFWSILGPAGAAGRLETAGFASRMERKLTAYGENSTAFVGVPKKKPATRGPGGGLRGGESGLLHESGLDGLDRDPDALRAAIGHLDADLLEIR